MNPLVSAPVTAILAFLTIGLTFAAIQSRIKGEAYLLFWRNPLSPRAQRFMQRMFFQGPAAEFGRILLLCIATLMFAADLFGLN